jgi:pilus assembly protein CpaF
LAEWEKKMDRIKELLQQRVITEIDLYRDVTDEELFETIDRILIEHSKTEYISIQEKQRLKKEIFNAIRRLDILQELIEDPSITEIMVNGPDHIYIERDGKIYPSNKHFESKQKLEDVIQQIVKVK